MTAGAPAAEPGPLVVAVRGRLRAEQDAARAPQMQRYMKSAMPYLGVRVPRVREIVRQAVREYPVSHAGELLAAARDLWRLADFREERYAATELIGLRPVRGDLAALGLLREMIVTGAWWDHVDALSHEVGALLLAHREEMIPRVVRWSTDPDRWLRCAAIICQLGHRDRTDPRLLRDVIVVNAADREFFVRKAIGWALRDYARWNPEWVRAFVAEHEAALSPLSRREATRHLG